MDVIINFILKIIFYSSMYYFFKYYFSSKQDKCKKIYIPQDDIDEKINNIPPVESPSIKFESTIENEKSSLNDLYLLDKIITNELTNTERGVQSFNF